MSEDHLMKLSLLAVLTNVLEDPVGSMDGGLLRKDLLGLQLRVDLRPANEAADDEASPDQHEGAAEEPGKCFFFKFFLFYP